MKLVPSSSHRLAHQLEDLGLDRHVEGRGGLVGDDERGPAGDGHGDHHPLAQAAGKLVREGLGPARRVGDADRLEKPTASAAEPAASATWRPTRMVGLSDVIGSWNTAPRCRRRDDPPVLGDADDHVGPQTTAGPVTAGGGWVGSRPSSDSPSTLLPEPDSPTRPRISPGRPPGHPPDGTDTVARCVERTCRSSMATDGAPSPGLPRPETGPSPRLRGGRQRTRAGRHAVRHHLAE